MLTLNGVIKILSAAKPELSKRYPISSIGLFGSVVRDDFTEESDIDIIVDFNGKIGMDFITLAYDLENKFNRKVDLVSRGGIKQKYFDYIASEIVYV